MTGAIRRLRMRSMRSGSFESSRSVKNLERLSKKQSNNQATGQSGTVDFSRHSPISINSAPKYQRCRSLCFWKFVSLHPLALLARGMDPNEVDVRFPKHQVVRGLEECSFHLRSLHGKAPGANDISVAAQECC